MAIVRIHQAGLEVNANQSLDLEFDSHQGAGLTVTNTAPKTGNYHIHLAATTGAVHNATKLLPGGPYTQIRGGFHLKVNNHSWASSGETSTNPSLIAFYDGAMLVCKIVIGDNGVWTAHVAGNVIMGDRAMREDVYLHFGFQFKLNDTTGQLWVYEDGLKIIGEADIDTVGATGATKIDRVVIGTLATTEKVTCEIDDFYVDDTGVAPAETTFGPVPDLRFEFLLPNNNGDLSQFIGSDGDSIDNFTLVDERPHDGDNTYVKAVSAGVEDLYQMQDIVLQPGWTINAVIPCTIARKVNAADDTKIQLRLRTTPGQTAGDFEGPERELLPYYTLLWERKETNPDGEVPWDEAAVNALQVGVKSAGTF